MTVNKKRKIEIPKKKVAEFCRRHHIRKLSIFGSALGEHFGEDSDIDVLVDYEPGQVIGFRIFDMEAELSRMLGGVKVDIVNVKYLNHRLREHILESAEVQYAEG